MPYVLHCASCFKTFFLALLSILSSWCCGDGVLNSDFHILVKDGVKSEVYKLP